MSGTVNISRRIWHDTAFKAEPFTEREAFMWMIMEASYKDREKRVGNVAVKLSRGQLATSVRFMCEAWGWSKSRVDRFLKRLENRDMIGTDSGTGVNVITVCKYDDYQSKPNESGTAGSKKRDSSGTAAGQQRDKPNKGLIPEEIPEATSSQEVAGYQDFLKAHPRPVASQAGAKAFADLIAAGEKAEVIIGAARAYAEVVKRWSSEGKVQQSDNFLDPVRGKWRDYIAKPAAVPASTEDRMKFWAESINEGRFVSAATLTPAFIRDLIDAGLVTPEKLAERGIAA
ncbi:hypothetical protein [Yoonia sp.]|uniref:hypothetical protein n=1 Tax=Yoonia sp. TaxID=2212373 RepID=UPI002E08B1CD|nr:hypothetical protein [Yoonia sp.]